MKILLVDDEPIFIEDLKDIISRYRLKEEIHIEFVYSAEEALDIIPTFMPDCVFSDIKMSSMDGIDLSKSIQEKWLGITVVIISGYPSFDYAKEAMKASVIDYLTKPVSPEEIYNILDRIYDKSQEKKYDETKDYLKLVLQTRNINVDSPLNKQYEKRYPYFYCIVGEQIDGLHSGGLYLPLPSEKQYVAYIEIVRKELGDSEDVWVINDSSHGDVLIILGLLQYNHKKINKILTRTSQHFMSVSNQVPISIGHGKVYKSLQEMNNSLPFIRERLLNSKRIGHSQIIDAYGATDIDTQSSLLFSLIVQNKLLTFISSRQWELLKKELSTLFGYWEKEIFTCVAIEQNLKKITQLFENHNPNRDAISLSTMEKRIEEIVYNAIEYKELQEGYWQILLDHFNIEMEYSHYDSQNFFNEIKQYLQSNLQEPITLSSLTEKFNVSRTYLCNIFRKEADQSFVEYFTNLRIEKAKALITLHPDLLLKDVAYMVGYEDHYYFSRVFKNKLGISPSKYKESNLNGDGHE